MSGIPTLGYWDLRAKAEPIRYLLRFAGVEFNDKRYKFGPGTTMTEMKSIVKEWLIEKQQLGLDFPNLPYYIEGDIKLTQSVAILRYLARKHSLIATDDQTLTRQELVEQQILEMDRKLFHLLLDEEYLPKKQNYINEVLTPQLEALAKFLGSNEWLTSKFSYVDIYGYEILDRIRLFTPETIGKFPTLGQYLMRFEAIPRIKEYQNSPQYKSWPIYGPVLHWGFNQ